MSRKFALAGSRPCLEHLESRTLLSTIVTDSPFPVPVPTPPIDKGDQIKILVDFQTTDPEEASEDETLVVQSSGGFSQTYLVAYQSRNYQTYTAVKDGETFSAFINGADGDESATITITTPGVDLSASINNITVHPQQAPDLQLNSIFSGEKLVVPVVVTNIGSDKASGSANISFYLSPTPTYDPNTAIPVQAGNLTNQAIDLQSFQKKTFAATVTVPQDDSLERGNQVYVVAVLSSNIAENDVVNSNDANNVAATQQYEYLGTPGASFSQSLYFDAVKKTLKGYDPFANQGSPTPADGPHYTAAFETPGGYDNPVTHSYLDTATPPNPTIGIGLNLNALYPDVSTQMAADVRAYYAANHLGDLSQSTDAQIIQMLKDQASPTNPQHGQQVMTKTDAQNLFEMTYAHHKTVVDNLVGAVPSNVEWVLVDIDFNAKAGVAGFHNLLSSIASADYVLAGFDLIDSLRASQVQPDRIVANYEYLLQGNESLLGQISAS